MKRETWDVSWVAGFGVTALAFGITGVKNPRERAARRGVFSTIPEELLWFQEARPPLRASEMEGLSCFWTELGAHIRMAVTTQAARLRTIVAETPGGRWAPPWETPRTHSAPPWEKCGRGDGFSSNGMTVRGASGGIMAA